MRERCQMRSAVTGQQCALEDGHPCDSPTRFHRFRVAADAPAEHPAEAEPWMCDHPCCGMCHSLLPSDVDRMIADLAAARGAVTQDAWKRCVTCGDRWRMGMSDIAKVRERLRDYLTYRHGDGRLTPLFENEAADLRALLAHSEQMERRVAEGRQR